VTAFLLSAAIAAPPGPVAADAALPADAQWAAIAACPRVGGGPGEVAAATAACVGCRDGFAYLLTAAHAVPKGEARAYEFFARDTYPRPARTLTRGEVVLRLADADVALVKLPVGAAPVPALRLAPAGARPRRFPFAALSVGCPDGLPPRCRGERVVGKPLVRRPGGGAAFYWQAAAPPVGGMSGGPLLDGEGRVVGVCAAARGGQGYFAHADEILAGLKAAGYAWVFEG
jgi:S1-C subfamily serine protease